MSERQNSGSVLFVCLGNICRSPIAEAVFAHLLRERGLERRWITDSAATSDWNVGNFYDWDFIFAMDEENVRNLNRVRPSDARGVVRLLGDYDPEGVKIIEDPYYGDEKDFETVYEQCVRCCSAFLDEHS